MKNKKGHILYISYDGMTDPLGQSQVLPYLKGLAKKGYKKESITLNGGKAYTPPWRNMI